MSLYNHASSYHMQYYHGTLLRLLLPSSCTNPLHPTQGISSRTHLPFSPPAAFQLTSRPDASLSKHERTTVVEGLCHACTRWVALEGVKSGEAKVRLFYPLFWSSSLVIGFMFYLLISPSSPSLFVSTYYRSRRFTGKHTPLPQPFRTSRHVSLRNAQLIILKPMVVNRWKHAAMCHQGSNIPGECDVFFDDA
jgi:hypothetical protein